MKDYYEIIDLKPSIQRSICGASYTFVSNETLDNIFPSIEVELDISDQKFTIREKTYYEELKASLDNKLKEHPQIWEKLANL